MDSMRSLNTSLPSSTPPQPPEVLLQSFKAAALSVTNLYKNAVHEQSQAKHAGYQEAIEDLLQFLDREDLGLGDGEGWKVRQWATQRSDGSGAPSGDDDERGDVDKRDRSASPVAVRKEQPEPEATRQASKPASPPKEEPAAAQPPQPSSHPQSQPTDMNALDKPAIFTFSAAPSFPQCQEQDVDMQPSVDSTTPRQEGAPVSVSVLPRTPRQQHRHNNLSRANARSSTREPSVGLGSKRKLNFPDFFDLSGLGSNRDMFGGGKRGRFT